MTVSNDFLPFATGGGANVETQAAYAADPDLPLGNQPGVASSAFNNKALRQANVIASQVAQYVANQTQTNVQDNTNMAQLLSQMFATFSRKAPVLTTYLSGSSTHNLSYKFQVASANATAGATYSDGVTTFTVSATIAAGLELVAKGSAAPVTSGTLTKASGTGDATIIFYAVRAPLYIRVRAVGGGGGGGGSGGAASAGSNGGDTSFGTTLIVAHGGTGGLSNEGANAGGGNGNLGTGPVGIAVTGGSGSGGAGGGAGYSVSGGNGGGSALGGNGGGGSPTVSGAPGTANTGGGGGGGGALNTALDDSGSGGGAGGYVDAIITSPLSTYAVVIGGGGGGGAGSGGGGSGGSGGSGYADVTEYFQ